MKKVNDSTSHPLMYITEEGKTYGQFYNSIDKICHLAEYIPYEKRPTKYVCGGTGNFSSCRTETLKRCSKCFSIIPEEVR